MASLVPMCLCGESFFPPIGYDKAGIGKLENLEYVVGRVVGHAPVHNFFDRPLLEKDFSETFLTLILYN